MVIMITNFLIILIMIITIIGFALQGGSPLSGTLSYPEAQNPSAYIYMTLCVDRVKLRNYGIRYKQRYSRHRKAYSHIDIDTTWK